MRIKHIFVALLTSMVVLSSCDQSDDLNEIFLGKTWKLTNIFWDDGGQRPCTDYWTGENAEEERNKSYEMLLNDYTKFILHFDGLETENEINGAFTGYGTTASIEGKWNANGKKNTFGVSDLTSGSENDKLGIAFINGLKTAYKYSGDAGSGLQIYFKDATNRKRYLLLRVVNE